MDLRLWNIGSVGRYISYCVACSGSSGLRSAVVLDVWQKLRSSTFSRFSTFSVRSLAYFFCYTSNSLDDYPSHFLPGFYFDLYVHGPSFFMLYFLDFLCLTHLSHILRQAGFNYPCLTTKELAVAVTVMWRRVAQSVKFRIATIFILIHRWLEFPRRILSGNFRFSPA